MEGGRTVRGGGIGSPDGAVTLPSLTDRVVHSALHPEALWIDALGPKRDKGLDAVAPLGRGITGRVVRAPGRGARITHTLKLRATPAVERDRGVAEAAAADPCSARLARPLADYIGAERVRVARPHGFTAGPGGCRDVPSRAHTPTVDGRALCVGLGARLPFAHVHRNLVSAAAQADTPQRRQKDRENQ